MQQLGRYQILGELGRGAMGVVYRALDPAIGRGVAIKTIRLAEITGPAERTRLRERLMREAQAAGILSHPGIVAIYDVGQEGETTYIAMEFVTGVSLDRLMLGEPPSPDTILSVVRQTAAALDYAHKKGIVHRDIKPANLMLGEDGVLKITDFGVAKISTSQHLTQAGTVIGTPNYMSPEQIQGREVDGRADQFSLAVIAYELLTGEKPFAGDQLTTVLYRIVTENPPAPHHVNPTLSWAAGMVVAKALSKEPADRYASCAEFAGALEAALNTKRDWQPLPHGASQNLPTAVLTPRPAIALEAPAAPPPAPPAPARSRRRLILGTLTAILAGLVVGGFVFVAAQRWLQPAPERQPAPSAAQTEPAPAPAKPSPMPPPVSETVPAPSAGALPAQPPSQDQPATPAPRPADTPSPREEPAAPATPTADTPPPPVVAAPPARPPSTVAVPLVEQPIQVVTSPPGAQVVPDGLSAKACKAPCYLRMLPGRHTLAVTLPGHRRELRIFEVTAQPLEVFISLIAATGTVRIESDPPGAAITVDGQARLEQTPATLTLPAGKHRVTVNRGSARAERDIEVRDGALVKVDFSLHS